MAMVCNDKVKVLLVEDNEGDVRLMKEIMRETGAAHFELTHVADLGSALRSLDRTRFDVVLLDLDLPDSRGLDTFHKVQEKAVLVPVIILTGLDDDEASTDAVRGGAQDFLIKGRVDGSLLERAIVYAIERKRYECALHLRNSELSMLYRISRTISLSMDLDELFANVLDAIVNLETLDIEQRAGLFLLDGDNLTLASHVGLSESFCELHSGLRTSDCLCGIAARTGEVVVSRDDCADVRHTVRDPGTGPHGHVIVPVKSREKIVGVLFLFTRVGMDVDERRVETFMSIGNQLGLAIENARLYQETRELALRDPLTGLANRRLLHIVFERTLAKARRKEGRCSVIMLDIDDFKKYNDTYGHTGGDALLVEIATIIRQEIRDIDLGVRYGGEEFLVLLPETDVSSAYKVAERLKAVVEEKTEVTISLGIASGGSESAGQQQLIGTADEALYRAKQGGKNRVEVGF